MSEHRSQPLALGLGVGMKLLPVQTPLVLQCLVLASRGTLGGRCPLFHMPPAAWGPWTVRSPREDSLPALSRCPALLPWSASSPVHTCCVSGVAEMGVNQGLGPETFQRLKGLGLQQQESPATHAEPRTAGSAESRRGGGAPGNASPWRTGASSFTPFCWADCESPSCLCPFLTLGLFDHINIFSYLII